jgi:hypothetical protein
MKLPSNKVSGIFIIVVLVVVLVISGDVISDKLKKNNVSPEIIDADLTIRRNTTDNSSSDTDGDGLLDWQEKLYSSDPNSSDTDGDGTNDGDEIRDGRDPTIPGPDDELLGYSDLFKTEFDVPGYTPGSLTDTLSKNLFADYWQLKQTNNLNVETGNQLINNLTDQVKKDSGFENKYKIENLNLVESNDESLKKYGEEFAIIHVDYIKQLGAIQTVDNNQYIKDVSNIYQTFANSLNVIEVPDVAGNVHIAIVNKLNNEGVFLVEALEYETDPLKALVAIKKIQENQQNEVELYKSLANYLRDNDIIFEDNDIIRFWNAFE